MYPRTDKRRLYQIVDMLLTGKVDESSFCDEFYLTFDIELDLDTLSMDESRLFGDLSDIAARFSRFEEDHIKYPGVFYTKDDLRAKAAEIKEVLRENFEKIS